MKKILIVSDAAEPQVNGVVKTMRYVREHLSERGNEILNVVPSMFKTFPCPTYPEIRLALTGSRGVGKLIRDFQPDCIHICTEGPLGLAARKFCKKNNLRFTSSYHTKFPEYVKERFLLPLKAGYAYMRWFHSLSASMLVPTRSVAEELKLWGFINTAVWTRGVDRNKIGKGKDDYFKDLEQPVFINVGRVAVEKNIDAFLSLDLPGTKVLVGDGPYLPALKKKYPNVIFKGYVSGQQLADCYSSADVFVFSSKTDTFGLVMIEAMVSGTPVAACNVPGPCDVVSHGVNGILADDDSYSLKEACMKALDFDRSKVKESVENFRWENCASIFYDNLVDCGLSQRN